MAGNITKNGFSASMKDMLLNSAKRGDLFFAFASILMLVILIMPMPVWLLDISLALSITLACVVLMMAIFIEKPIEFSSFPLVLLITTMYRLALNLASTRLILSRGYLGDDAAGEVIKAFGGFIMGNNFVIGVIVFAILVLVNHGSILLIDLLSHSLLTHDFCISDSGHTICVVLLVDQARLHTFCLYTSLF